MLIVLVVTVILWMTSSFHHLSVSAVSVVPIVFLTMTSILKSEDIRKIPWDTLLLVAGGLSLGLALAGYQTPGTFRQSYNGYHSGFIYHVPGICIRYDDIQ